MVQILLASLFGRAGTALAATERETHPLRPSLRTGAPLPKGEARRTVKCKDVRPYCSVNCDLSACLVFSAAIRAGVLLTIKAIVCCRFYNTFGRKRGTNVHIVVIAKVDNEIFGCKL